MTDDEAGSASLGPFILRRVLSGDAAEPPVLLVLRGRGAAAAIELLVAMDEVRGLSARKMVVHPDDLRRPAVAAGPATAVTLPVDLVSNASSSVDGDDGANVSRLALCWYGQSLSFIEDILVLHSCRCINCQYSIIYHCYYYCGRRFHCCCPSMRSFADRRCVCMYGVLECRLILRVTQQLKGLLEV